MERIPSYFKKVTIIYIFLHEKIHLISYKKAKLFDRLEIFGPNLEIKLKLQEDATYSHMISLWLHTITHSTHTQS